jgi:hypothetical protein
VLSKPVVEVSSGIKSESVNALRFEGTKSGQFTIGWTLPRGRGQYLLTYTGIADGDFELDASGTQASYQKSGSQAQQVIYFESLRNK